MDEPTSTSVPGTTATTYRPRGLLLQWHITHRCNLRCAHCYQDCYGGAGEMVFDELLDVLRQYEALLAEWRSAAGRRSLVRGHITLTGGEPFVRKDFLRLLERVASASRDHSFAILTNGSYIDLATARKLRRLRPRFIQVSIEGSETTHDRIRGPGDFRRTTAAIKRLVSFNIPTMISFTAHRGNYREFPDVARLGVNLGVARVWSDRLIPTLGSGKLGTADVLTANETSEYVAIMAQTKAELRRRWFSRTEISMHRALQFMVDGGGAYHCTAGDSLITVMPDGTVYPCRRMPIRVGNLRHSTLRDVYYGSDLLRRLRDPKATSSGCESCRHASSCRGGLKCLSYALTGDPFRRDPGCWLPQETASPQAASPHPSTCAEVGYV